MSEFLRRGPSGRQSPASEPAEDCALSLRFVALTEFLTVSEWEPGTARETGTLLVCTGDGRWRAWLNDRDNQMAAWASSATLEGLLNALEQGLRVGGLEWRSTRPRGRK